MPGARSFSCQVPALEELRKKLLKSRCTSPAPGAEDLSGCCELEGCGLVELQEGEVLTIDHSGESPFHAASAADPNALSIPPDGPCMQARRRRSKRFVTSFPNGSGTCQRMSGSFASLPRRQ